MSPMPNDPATPAQEPPKLANEPVGRWRVTGKGVLAALLLSIVAEPFLEHFRAGLLIESVIFTSVLLLGVLAVGGKRRTLLTALVLLLPAVVCRWMNHATTQSGLLEGYLVFAVLTLGYVAWHFLTYIMGARRVDSNVLCSGIATFLLLGFLWAFVYQLIDRQIPGSFSWPGGAPASNEMKGPVAVYFSIVTLCTVGFGDVLPVSPMARMAAMLEGATGVFFVAVLISRLVSLHTVTQQERPHGEEDRANRR